MGPVRLELTSNGLKVRCIDHFRFEPLARNIGIEPIHHRVKAGCRPSWLVPNNWHPRRELNTRPPRSEHGILPLNYVGMVRVTRFERATSAPQTRPSTTDLHPDDGADDVN